MNQSSLLPYHYLQDLLGLVLLLLAAGWARKLRRVVEDWRATKAALGDQLFGLLRELPPVRKKLEVGLGLVVGHSATGIADIDSVIIDRWIKSNK